MEGAGGQAVSCPYPIVGHRRGIQHRERGASPAGARGGDHRPASLAQPQTLLQPQFGGKTSLRPLGFWSVSIVSLGSLGDAPLLSSLGAWLSAWAWFTVSDPRWLDEPVPPQPQLPGQPKLGPSCLEPQQLPLIPTSFCGHCRNVKATSVWPATQSPQSV